MGKLRTVGMMLILVLMCMSGIVDGRCRLKDNYYEAAVFKQRACCTCYKLLFDNATSHVGTGGFCDDTTNQIVIAGETSVEPDPYNSKSAAIICDLLGGDHYCDRWKQCCNDASACCDMMEESSSPSLSADAPAPENTSTECPAVWDSFTCWRKAPARSSPTSACPLFLMSGSAECLNPDDHYVERECLPSGEWNSTLSRFFKGSNYSRCSLSLHCFMPLERTKYILAIVCQAVSLAAVIPATLIFLLQRSLRSQQRICIHINLFLSQIIYDFVNLLYTVLVNGQEGDSALGQSYAIECRVLSAVNKFALIAVFVWMFMEGFYLNWLMVNTFHQPKFLWLAVTGWGVSGLITGVYVLLRVLNAEANTGCWMMSFDIDWLINVPLIICLLMNLIFLVNILRIILTQVSIQQNEPSFYRRAVKATAMLVPPFGLTLILLLYSPLSEESIKSKLIYDCFKAVLLHLQGLFLSIILCYSNGEVISSMKKSLYRNLPCCSQEQQQVYEASMVTAMSHISTRRTSGYSEANQHSTPTQETSLLVKNIPVDKNGNQK